MALTRRSFFGHFAALAVGAVLAARPQPKPVPAPKPEYWYLSYGGTIWISDEHLDRNTIMFVNRETLREIERLSRLDLEDLNRGFLEGQGIGTPKGFLSAS